MERLNVILDTLDELSLVFSDSASDVRSHEEGIETREDAKHLICIAGRPELIPKTSCDPRFNTINTLIISASQNNKKSQA